MVRVFSQISSELAGALFSEAAQMTFSQGRPPLNSPAANGNTLLVQQLTIRYQQPFSRFYEVYGSGIYFVAGRTKGTASLIRVCGPLATMQSFFGIVGPALPASGNVVDFAMLKGGKSDSKVEKASCFIDEYRAEDCSLRSIGFNSVVADMAINEGAALGFCNLEPTA